MDSLSRRAFLSAFRDSRLRYVTRFIQKKIILFFSLRNSCRLVAIAIWVCDVFKGDHVLRDRNSP